MIKKYTLEELQALPTLSQGQTDDLKIENKSNRVWLSRMTIEDGMPYNNQVTVEKFIRSPKKAFLGGKWETVHEYEAK